MYSVDTYAEFVTKIARETEGNVDKQFNSWVNNVIQSVKSSRNKTSFIQELLREPALNSKIMDSNVISYYLMKQDAISTECMDDILSHSSSIDAALKVFEKQLSSISGRRLYQLAEMSLTKKDLVQYFSTKINHYKTEIPINENALMYLQKYAEEKVHGWPLRFIKNESIAKQYVNENPEDERAKTALINNRFMSEEFKKKLFESGCIVEDIVEFTPEIAKLVYENLMESAKELLYNQNPEVGKQAVEYLTIMITNNDLTKECEEDVLREYITEPNQRYLKDLANAVAFATTNETIIKSIVNGHYPDELKRRAIANNHLPTSIMKAEVQKILQSSKAGVPFGYVDKKFIIRALKETQLADVADYDKIWAEGTDEIRLALAQSPYTPEKLLKKMIEECSIKNSNSIQEIITVCAAINYYLNGQSHNGVKTKSLYHDAMMLTAENSVRYGSSIHLHHMKPQNYEHILKCCLDAKNMLSFNAKEYTEGLINLLKRSHRLDMEYEKLGITVLKRNYIVNHDETQVQQSTMKNIYKVPSDTIKDALRSFDKREIETLQRGLWLQIAHIDTKNLIISLSDFYENINDYIRVDKCFDEIIKEKENEKTRIKQEEIEER